MLEDLGARVQTVFETAAIPFRAIMTSVGLEPSFGEVWAFMVGLFLLGLIVPEAYSSYVLRHRQVRTTGVVAAIDTSGESPYSPTIRFKDNIGREWQFDSDLPCNARTGTVGASVLIIYDPLNPKRAREQGRFIMKAFTVVVWWGFTAVIFAVAFGVVR